MGPQETDVRRFPLWLTRAVGILTSGGGAFFALSNMMFGLQIEWGFPRFYGILAGGSLFALGMGTACSKKGLPMGWRERSRLRRQAQEVPEGLGESFSTTERLEHLEIMKEQGSLSEEEAAAWREKILESEP